MLFTEIQDSDIIAARIAIEKAYNQREQLMKSRQIAYQTLKSIDEVEEISEDEIKEILEDFNLKNDTDFKNLKDLKSYIAKSNNILALVDIVFGEEKKE